MFSVPALRRHLPWQRTRGGTVAASTRRFPILPSSIAVALLAAALGWPGAPAAHAAPTDRPAAPMDIPNGNVFVTKIRGDVAYLGGQFDQVGPFTGPGVGLDAGSGRDLELPRVTNSGGMGAVTSVISDGAGGWYIGGQFDAVGGVPRANAARILADGSVAAWNPDVDGMVTAMARSGSTVYLAGRFAEANDGSTTRNHAAAVDATTGAVTGWHPDVNGDVNAIAVAGGVVYLGGEFSTVGGAARGNVAAVSATTGTVSSWNPGADRLVSALAVADGKVYAGGEFSNVGGEARERLAELSAASGSATAWRADANGDVFALAVDPSDGTVYVGGAFEQIGGVERRHAAAISSASAVRAWNPDAGGAVRSVALAGSTVYLGGAFVTIGGADRRFVGAVDAATGSPTGWDPRVSSVAYAVAASGATVYAGGVFTSIGGVTRRNAAAIDLRTGRATAWNPDVADAVRALEFSGSTVYIGGRFEGANAINGSLTRRHLAAVNDTTGAATSWNPSPDDEVAVLKVAGGRMYVGGRFRNIAGQSRVAAAAFDLPTGTLANWDPVARPPEPYPGMPDPVASIAGLDVAGSTVYLSGGFVSLGGQVRDGLGAVDTDTGALKAWAPQIDGSVLSVAVRGSTAYLVGMFTTANGVPRGNAAAVDATTGDLGPWAPRFDGWLWSVTPTASAVYVAGLYSEVSAVNGTFPRVSLAAVDPVTGAVMGWSPPATGLTMAVDATDSLLFAGGTYAFSSGASALFGEPAQVTGPADQAVVAGSAATFAPEVSGAPAPFRQWQVSTDGGATFTDLAGEDGATLTVRPTLDQSGWRYRLRAANLVGSAVGPAATLTVSPVPGSEPPPDGRAPPEGMPRPPAPAAGVAVVTRTATLKKGMVRVTLRCVGKKPCAGKLRVVATKTKRKPTVATARYSIRPGKRITLKLRVTTPARRLLEKPRSRLLTTITLTPKSGKKVTAKLTIRAGR